MKETKSYVWIAIIVVVLVVLLGCCCFSSIFPMLISFDKDNIYIPFYLANFNFWIDVLTGFLTIIAFAWAGRQFIWEREQFKESQEKADLDLVFLDRGRQDDMSEGVITAISKNEITIDISKITRINNTDLNFLRVGLINSGSVIGLWYRIKLKSFKLYKDADQFWVFRLVAGNMDNWRGTNESRGNYVFKSLGEEAVYPDDPIYLLAIPFGNSNRYRSECQIDYSIVTEQERKDGVLIIKIIGARCPSA